MELTKDMCEAAILKIKKALDELEYDELHHEYEVLNQLVKKHFQLLFELKDCRRELDIFYELLKMMINQPLKFEEINEGMWLWDNEKKRYMKVYDISYAEKSFNVNGEWFFDDLYLDSFEFEENRFYRKEVKDVDIR